METRTRKGKRSVVFIMLFVVLVIGGSWFYVNQISRYQFQSVVEITESGNYIGGIDINNNSSNVFY